MARRTPPAPPDRERRVQRLRRLARLMDSRFRIPGTRYRIGLDGLLGLVPAGGDLAGFAVSAYIVHEARKLGASGPTQARMVANILVDAVLGSIPLIGDVFDIAFKANLRNLRMLGIDPRADAAEGRAARASAAATSPERPPPADPR